jgi:hypothetical protein
MARQLFGDDSPIVIHHRERVMDMNHARHQAIDEARQLGAEKAQREGETTAKQQESRINLWKQVNGDISSKFPDWLNPKEGDDEGNRLLETASKQADMAFSDNNGLSLEDTVKLHALIRSRAAAFPRSAHLNSKLQARVKELEGELEKFRTSEPTLGNGKGVEPVGDDFEELRADA